MTLERLRSHIRPVALADFLRFLLRWQHVDPEHRVEGPEGLARVLEQLEGFEAAIGAWEQELLPARVRAYDPAWLDQLCLSGRISWLRLSSPTKSSQGPARSTRIALVRRKHLHAWRSLGRPTHDLDALRPDSRSVAEALAHHGASFSFDLVEVTGLDAGRVEDALAELVTHGLATCDGFAGLRALVGPRRTQHVVGRWSLLPATVDADEDDVVEHAARVLLRRYGIVVRSLLERERWAPRWYDLLRVYRRLEARGEIRGGRFVDGVAGEQYATPEAVAMVREVRRDEADRASVVLAATDPLNLVGILTPGPRLRANSGTRVRMSDTIAGRM